MVLENAEPRFRDRRDRALLHAVVLGVLRRRSALDHVLQGISSRPLDRLTPGILEALRVGAFLLTCMDRVPSFAVLDVLAGVAREIGGGAAAWTGRKNDGPFLNLRPATWTAWPGFTGTRPGCSAGWPRGWGRSGRWNE